MLVLLPEHATHDGETAALASSGQTWVREYRKKKGIKL